MEKRERIWIRDNGKCTCCGVELHIDKARYSDKNYCQLDHIIPKSLSGSSDETNLRAICRSCNGRRQNKSGIKLMSMYEKRVLGSSIINDLEHFKFDVENCILDSKDLTRLKKQVEKVFHLNMIAINGLLELSCKGDDWYE